MKERVEKWDILKFELIFLVVLGHICDQYIKESAAVRAIWLMIYSFHMPLFFFVSGLFSKNKINRMQYGRIFSYFALYIVTQAVFWLSKILFLQDFTIQLLDTKDAPWFIFVLFLYYLITIAIRQFDGKYILGGCVLLACMAGYDGDISDMFQLSRLIVFYPFFYLGYLLDEKQIRELVSGKKIRIFSAVGIVIFMFVICSNVDTVYLLRPILTGRNSFSKLSESLYPFGALLRLAYYCVACFIGMMVIAVTPQKLKWSGIARWGSRSVQVYILHRPCIILLCNRLVISEWFRVIWPEHYHLMIIPMALVITVFGSWKIFELPVKKLIEPKVRKNERVI